MMQLKIEKKKIFFFLRNACNTNEDRQCYSVLWNALYGEMNLKRVGICIHTTESLCYTTKNSAAL